MFARVDWDPTAIALGRQQASQQALSLNLQNHLQPQSLGFSEQGFPWASWIDSFSYSISHQSPAQSSYLRKREFGKWCMFFFLSSLVSPLPFVDFFGFSEGRLQMVFSCPSGGFEILGYSPEG